MIGYIWLQNGKLVSNMSNSFIFFIYNQAGQWMGQSVSPVCPSVIPFWLGSHLLMKFLGVITIARNDVWAKSQDQRSKDKFTQVKTQFSCFWTVNSSLNSHLAMKLCTKLWCGIGEVPYCFSRYSVKFRGHMGPQNCRIWCFRTATPV